MVKWRIMIDLSYIDRAVVIKEFERICEEFKHSNYSKCAAGNSTAQYCIRGPEIERLTDDEIIKLRRLLNG